MGMQTAARSERPASVRGRLLVDGAWQSGLVILEEGRIARIASADERAPEPCLDGHFVAPGLIDLQDNGGFGVEIGASANAITHLEARLPQTGVTGFLPTLVTSPADFYPGAYEAFRAARASATRGARALGLHLEGPFLSPHAAGAHHREWIESARWELLDALLEGDALAIMTLAPERPGALEAIARLTDRGVLVSLGHTAATYDELVRGIDAGARMVTHLFNAMTPFHHRAPGALGAALTDDRVTVGIVPDGVHCQPAALRLAFRAKGVLGIALVTDAMSAAGMAPGTYELAGKKVLVDGTSARLEDGTLAGSILTLDEAVRRMVALGGVRAEDALRMASEVPARLLGLPHKGRLAVGCDADLVVLDDQLRVAMTLVAGELVYSAV
jgi:N-acetylglucosamine-6-phosphate deacetylase